MPSGLIPVALYEADLFDLEALLCLERACQSHPWTERHFRGALEGERSRVLVLRRPWEPPDPTEGIAAYCVIESVAGEVHVHNLGVAPGLRRQGLGRRLLALALGSARRAGARVAHLEVRAGNGPAIALYRQAGFEPVGLRRNYYSSPSEDALLLVRQEAGDP
ncbi:MAG TPA: ribosomal protein S18-alanine N-acetyltransferase [Vicinamibacteria bacterium]|nr:ribosomal protein S18-alanine N-acetyltransferase [Vicinamibacteria bacterium]